MTATVKHKTGSVYFDKSLTVRIVTDGNPVTTDNDLYIGGYHHRLGVEGSGFDNFQIFHKALTIEEIAIIAVVNKDAITD